MTFTKEQKKEIKKIVKSEHEEFEKHTKSIRNVSMKTALFSGLLAGLIFSILIYDINDDQKLSVWIIAFVGIIAFFGMLMITSYHQEHHPKHVKGPKGVMRAAIASSFIIVYFIVLSLVLFGEQSIIQNVPREKILEHFTSIIIVIIGFYFGSKGAIELYKIKKGGDSDDTENTDDHEQQTEQKPKKSSKQQPDTEHDEDHNH